MYNHTINQGYIHTGPETVESAKDRAGGWFHVILSMVSLIIQIRQISLKYPYFEKDR